ncbi:small gtp binding protein rab8 [Anaeramoeba ignava]|uniref:Small gtp binding protein rab8 n=1 Tax=Anaeramoeba ignava TaxID=1746090 RepID=A0A9Q0LI10_ANAIG|nr:small gtp binding protein rab8 [Anaeramoeba ignava]
MQNKKEKEEEKYDFMLNILLIGDYGVGKTNIVMRYSDNEFGNFPDTISQVEFKTKKIEIGGKIIKLELRDSSGQERVTQIGQSYYKGVHGIFLVYDITNKDSFRNIKTRWFYDIRKYANENVQIILIGNKNDLEEKRIISKEEGKEFADKLEIPFYEISAKNNINIDDIFYHLTTNILENIDENNQLQPRIKDTIQNDFKQLFERKELCDFEIEFNILLEWIYFGKVLYSNLSILKEWKNKLSNICEIEFKRGTKSFLKDLEILMNSEETKDFQIISNNQIIKVHKIILLTRSELYRGMFINVTEDKTNQVHEYSNKQLETIQSLIHFFYTDELPKIEKSIIYEELKECVDYFQLNSKRLIQIIQKIEKEIENQNQIQIQNQKKSGDYKVGKTQMLSRFCDNQFTDEYKETIGVDLKMEIIEIEGKTIQLQIWDVAGQDDFRSIIPMYFRGAKGVLLVYDITNQNSFNNIKTRWIEDIKKNLNKTLQMILIGNKNDLEEKRIISKEKGKEFADKLQIPFYEVSAKNNINIDDAFFHLATNILENIDENNQLKPKNKYTIQEDFKQLFERKELCDFEIECKDDQNPLNKIKIPIHKLIIQNRLKINENQIKNELYSILSQNSEKEVNILLEWIYFGKVLYSNLSILKEWKNKFSNIICEIEFKRGTTSFLKDLEILMNSEETKDFQIISNKKKIKVHKIILLARSELYRGMFINVTEDKTNQVHEYSNKQLKTIQSLIHFFYTDELPKIEKSIIYEELKECVDYFQLNSTRLIQIIQKIENEKEKEKEKNVNPFETRCLIF